MKSIALCLAAAGLLPAVAPAFAATGTKDSRIFPHPYQIDDLPNGLRVITVPLPYPDLVSFYAVVRAGSRNEVEPGKSGFAHFFEHMMFRGTEKYPPEKYNEIFKVIGADHNAFTTDDYTAYHALFSKQDLPTVMELEADRFQNLKYPVDAFRTEAKAVLGEYNKNSANPINNLFEVLRDKAFVKHTYKHTTMGFLKDIEDMPNQFEYSRTFFDRFYRPENVVLLVVGDVSRDEVVALARKHWGGWKRGGFTQEIPVEPDPAGPHTVNVDWPTPTLPWVVVAYAGPAFSAERPDMAALDLASQIAFSSSAPVYQALVIDEQKVDSLFAFFRDSRDPGLVLVGARVKDVKDVGYVRDRILGAVEELRSTPVDPERLAAVKSNARYGLALSMDSTERVAGALASYIHLEPTPETLNRLYALYDRLTPQDIQRVARAYFTDRRRTIATLATAGTLPPLSDPVPAAAPSTSNGHAAEAASEGDGVGLLLRPDANPLVSFRVLLGVGAANDPEGREGLAALTAALLSRGGTREMTYQQIVQALYPTASGVSAQVDKEMTVFLGTTHVDNLEGYYRLFSSMLLEPGWKEEDFKRVKDDAMNYLKVNLRGNNDEELGKEALYQFIFGERHPYGHEGTGTLASLERLTLEDVKAFYRAHYTRANLTLGLAGSYPEGFAQRAAADFARLPRGTPSRVEVPPPDPVKGQHVMLIEKDTRSTAISFGFPIAATRAHEDWAALWLATSYLGQHRSSNSHLYQRIREARGLNYGDYAYIEHFPRGMFQFQPDPNLGRQRQIFQVWIRPVEPANAHFALRIALFELKKLIEEGLGEEDFENTRRFLDKYVAVLAKTQSVQLGYALDARYYGHGDFVPWVRAKLAALTRDQVNRAIRRHLSWQDLKVVIVAKDAAALRDALVSNAPSPITYNAPKPADVLEEDKLIEVFPLALRPESVRIVDVEDVFKQ